MKVGLKAVGVMAAACLAASSLAACSDDDGSSSASGDDGGGGDKKIVWVSGLANLAFFTSIGCAAEQAAKDAGYSFDVQAPERWDVTLQRPILDSVIASKPDAMLVTPTDAKALMAPLQQAKDAGIDIVLVDTTVEDPEAVAVSVVAANHYKIGEQAFAAMEEAVPDGGTVFLMDNAPGVSSANARIKGFEDAMAKNPKFSALPVEFGKGDPTLAAQLTSAALAKDSDIVGVFSSGSIEGSGVLTGIEQAGKTGDIAVVMGDTDPTEIAALKEGKVTALVGQAPVAIGEAAIEQLTTALDGGTPEPEVLIDPGTVTQENIDDPDVQEYIYKESC